MSETIECPECGWQGPRHTTDSRMCPDCGSECLELVDIYGPEGLFPDPDWKHGSL